LYVLFGEWLLAKADGETLADQAAYHVGIRGVHFMGSLFVGLIHLPVSTIVTKVMMIHYNLFPPSPPSPSSSSPLTCLSVHVCTYS
jgi:hypothetical protein